MTNDPRWHLEQVRRATAKLRRHIDRADEARRGYVHTIRRAFADGVSLYALAEVTGKDRNTIRTIVRKDLPDEGN